MDRRFNVIRVLQIQGQWQKMRVVDLCLRNNSVWFGCWIINIYEIMQIWRNHVKRWQFYTLLKCYHLVYAPDACTPYVANKPFLQIRNQIYIQKKSPNSKQTKLILSTRHIQICERGWISPSPARDTGIGLRRVYFLSRVICANVIRVLNFTCTIHNDGDVSMQAIHTWCH